MANCPLQEDNPARMLCSQTRPGQPQACPHCQPSPVQNSLLAGWGTAMRRYTVGSDSRMFSSWR